jgi:hypothetical protein
LSISSKVRHTIRQDVAVPFSRIREAPCLELEGSSGDGEMILRCRCFYSTELRNIYHFNDFE